MTPVLTKITGARELDQKLKLLNSKVATTIIRKGLRAQARVTQAAAIALAPVRTGALKSAIKVKAGKQRKGFAMVLAGVGKKWFTGDQFYAAFQEFGWKQGSRKRGADRKQMPGEHFMEYAFNETKQQGVKVLLDVVRKEIEKTIGGK